MAENKNIRYGMAVTIMRNNSLSALRYFVVLIMFCFFNMAWAGKTETKRVNVGDVFTVYTSYHSYTYSVLWSWDSSVLEILGNPGGADTSVSFRAKQATSLAPSIVQAITYYYKSGVPNSGVLKDVDDFRVFVTDNSTVSLSSGSIVLSPGESESLYASASSSYSGSYSWTSSNSSVVSISGYGASVTLYAGTTGSSTVRVTLDNGKYAECYVQVERVYPSSVSIRNQVTAYVGESTSLGVDVYPSNATVYYTWYCSPSSVASASGGSVYGKDEGMATVYCVTDNGVRSNDCIVTVKYRTATGVKVSKPTLYVPIGQKSTLTWTPVPSNARTSVTWKSDDKSIATVSSSGVVEGIKAGKTNITVTTDNGYTATCEVTVPPDPTRIEIPQKVSLYKGKTRTLKVQAYPADAYVKAEWESSDPSVASVSADGTVTAHNPGVAFITATAQNGVTSQCRLEVPETDFKFYVWSKAAGKEALSLRDHPVVTYKDGRLVVTTRKGSQSYAVTDFRKITMADEGNDRFPSAIVLPDELALELQDEYLLQYTLLPEDYDIETVITWTSDAPRIVSVDKEGRLKAVGVGEATVTARCANGATAQCHVEVLRPLFYFVVWLKDGNRDVFEVIDRPRVTYKDSNLSLELMENKVGKWTYTASKVRKFTMERRWRMTGVEGDVNSDGELSIADLVKAISFLGNSATVNKVADLDEDGRVTPQDITILRTLILKKNK